MVYHEPGNPQEGRLEGMKRKIESESKFTITLPDEVRIGIKIPELTDPLVKNIINDTILYSTKTGILRPWRFGHQEVVTLSQSSFAVDDIKIPYYSVWGKDDRDQEIAIFLDKNGVVTDIRNGDDARKIGLSVGGIGWF